MALLRFQSMRGLLAAAGVNASTWRVEVTRGLTCAAYGYAEPLFASRPYAVDAIAIHVRDDLADGGLELKLAAWVVRAYFDRWVEAVARAEHEGEDVIFGVAEIGDPASVKRGCVAGPFDELPSLFKAELPEGPVRRVIYIRLLEALYAIRRRSAEVGLDLSRGSFFVGPAHPELTAIKAYWDDWRKRNNITGERPTKFPPKLDRARQAAVAELFQ